MSGHAPALPPRGACPSLETPMAVADGLLVRLRPARGWLSGEELAVIAEAGAALGNGRIELSMRGSLQLRGLDGDGVERLRQRLDAAGLAVATGLVVERSPIAGDDPGELCDPRPLIADLEAVIAGLDMVFAPKLSVLVAAGGRYDLSRQAADIALIAAREGGWVLRLAGQALGRARADEVPVLIGVLLGALAGGRRRGRDLDAGVWAERFALPAGSVPTGAASGALPGALALRSGVAAHAIAVPFGQIDGLALAAFARGVSMKARLIPGPHRHLVVIEQDAATLAAAVSAAQNAGLWVDGGAGGLRLPLCSGAQGVGEKIIHTADVARMLIAAAPGGFDGTMHLHSATCGRGCGFRAAPGVRIVPGHAGFALVDHLRPDVPPLAWVRETAIEDDLASFARRHPAGAFKGQR